jgi:predicted nucleic acid-binding protein
MSTIVDASIAVKWVTDEIDSVRAEAVFAGEEELIAPDIILAEVGNALWKKLRGKTVTETQVTIAMSSMPSYFQQLVPCPELAPQALALAISLGHPVYDCFYLALAARERGTLVTADERLFAAARKARVKARML